jgi:hypothetical protein
MAVKVGLKDALDRPLTTDANGFLSDLVGREVELKLVSSRKYRISRPIRRTLIFSLEILEKIVMNVF